MFRFLRPNLASLKAWGLFIVISLFTSFSDTLSGGIPFVEWTLELKSFTNFSGVVYTYKNKTPQKICTKCFSLSWHTAPLWHFLTQLMYCRGQYSNHCKTFWNFLRTFSPDGCKLLRELLLDCLDLSSFWKLREHFLRYDLSFVEFLRILIAHQRLLTKTAHHCFIWKTFPRTPRPVTKYGLFPNYALWVAETFVWTL